ncbi:potassium channel family protein [Myxosarcina sp. GI1(2024)]
MGSKVLQGFAHNRYDRLLTALILYFVSRPLWQDSAWSVPISWGLTLIIIAIAIGGGFIQRGRKLQFLILAGLAFLTQLVGFIEIPEEWALSTLEENRSLVLMIISLGIVTNALFLLAAVSSITTQLFLERVTKDTIEGGICGYLLIGLLWSLLYNLSTLWDSNSIISTCEACQLDLLYFSFTTLSTLGYGDTIPVTTWTRMLANLEAIAGLMYPTIFIARLVGLYSRGEN